MSEQPVGATPPQPLQPLSVATGSIIRAGTFIWGLALVVTLVVPSLHSGERDWWPWSCVTGLVLGGLGLVYLRRGRGSAEGVGRG